MGIFFGPVAVGLYRLADRFMDNLLEVTMRPIAYVSLPFFSRLQNDRPALREAVASCVRTTLILTVPAMAVMAACSDFLMAVMGPEWEPAADVLKLLALVGIGKAIVFFTGPLLFAVARPHLRAVMLWILAALSAGIVIWSAGSSRTPRAPTRRSGWRSRVRRSSSRSSSRSTSPSSAGSRACARGASSAGSGRRSRPRRPGSPPCSSWRRPGSSTACPPFVGLIVAGTCSTLAAGGTLFALEPRARGLALPVVRKMMRRETDTAPA